MGFTNRSSRTIVVKTVTASCPCVHGKTDKETYAPGERGLLAISGMMAKPGKHVYYLGIETVPENRAYVEFKANVLGDYTITSMGCEFRLTGCESSAPRQILSIEYHGDASSRRRLVEAAVDSPDVQVRILKADWSAEELASLAEDPLKRPPLAQVEVLLTRPVEEYSPARGYPLRLQLDAPKKDSKVIVAAVGVQISNLYRSYPNPLVKPLFVEGDRASLDEEISITSLDKGRPLDDVVMQDLGASSPITAKLIARGSGAFAARIRWNPAFAVPKVDGDKLKGELVFRLTIGKKTFVEKVPWTLVCRKRG